MAGGALLLFVLVADSCDASGNCWFCWGGADAETVFSWSQVDDVGVQTFAVGLRAVVVLALPVELLESIDFFAAFST
jgi:hypothetical protein